MKKVAITSYICGLIQCEITSDIGASLRFFYQMQYGIGEIFLFSLFILLPGLAYSCIYERLNN